MDEYIFLVLTVILIGFFFIKGSKKLMLKIISLSLAFFGGFRYDVGVDYPNYEKIFNGVEYYETRELGFEYFVTFLNYIDAEPQLMFLILAILIQVLVYKIIKYYSMNFWLSIVVFMLIPPFFLNTFNGTRQFIAIAIFLYSLRYIEKKEYFKYFTCIFIGAFFFHESIIFVMIVFPFILKEFTLKFKFFLLLIVILFNFFIEVLVSYTPYFNYLQIEKKVEIGIFTYILFLFILLIVIFEKKLNDFKYKTLLLNLNYFSFLTLLLVLMQSKDVMIQMFMRLNNYFFFSYIIFIPNLISSMRKVNSRFIFSMGLVLVSLLYFLITIGIKGKEYHLVPFKFNFDLF